MHDLNTHCGLKLIDLAQRLTREAVILTRLLFGMRMIHKYDIGGETAHGISTLDTGMIAQGRVCHVACDERDVRAHSMLHFQRFVCQTSSDETFKQRKIEIVSLFCVDSK